MTMFKRASLLVAAMLLSGCSTPEPPIVRRAELTPEVVEITIHTSPAGGIVDWNGNVMGVAPVTIEVSACKPSPNTYPRWPYNGSMSQKFRARWPDGSVNWETFGSNEPIPQNIGIVSPTYRHNPLLDALIKDAHTPRALTQKRTGP
jgi:hypothetical protein